MPATVDLEHLVSGVIGHAGHTFLSIGRLNGPSLEHGRHGIV